MHDFGSMKLGGKKMEDEKVEHTVAFVQIKQNRLNIM
jgi:hypothetical protein